MKESNLLSAFIIALGLGIAGYFIGDAFYKGKKLDQYVTVKGLAEREVTADLAIWPITISEADDNLINLNQSLENKSALVKSFLKEQGFSASELTFNPASIIDRKAERYYGNNQNGYRYLGEVKITVRTGQISQLKEAFSKTSDLISQGVVMNQNDYQNRIEYLYTKLNDIKPEMIEEATKKAREAAEKFAADSDSQVGGIRQANQGLFSITNRDINSPDIKKIRVVSTIDYYLID